MLHLPFYSHLIHCNLTLFLYIYLLLFRLVHQRDVTRSMIDDGVSDVNDFRWLYHLRFDFNPHAENLVEKLRISLSNASFYYGFEYLGIGERLVQTPLTDRCYLTLTQALHFRMGEFWIDPLWFFCFA